MTCRFILILEPIREFLLTPFIQRAAEIQADNRLYCWVLELFEFPESKLKEDMLKYDVKSLV